MTQFTAALPQIVRANVKKAKEGSIQHTKYLLSLVKDIAKQGEEASAAGRSLAAVLMEELNEA